MRTPAPVLVVADAGAAPLVVLVAVVTLVAEDMEETEEVSLSYGMEEDDVETEPVSPILLLLLLLPAVDVLEGRGEEVSSAGVVWE